MVISPGHGYYLNDTSRWVLQRTPYFGIVEDFVNHDIVTDLYAALLEVGAEVASTRNLDRNAGLGESGFPKWQEAARYHLKAIGVPESVWNGSGGSHLGQDINARPRYANFLNAELLVSGVLSHELGIKKQAMPIRRCGLDILGDHRLGKERE